MWYDETKNKTMDQKKKKQAEEKSPRKGIRIRDPLVCLLRNSVETLN